jgi:hypothetical protein
MQNADWEAPLHNSQAGVQGRHFLPGYFPPLLCPLAGATPSSCGVAHWWGCQKLLGQASSCIFLDHDICPSRKRDGTELQIGGWRELQSEKTSSLRGHRTVSERKENPYTLSAGICLGCSLEHILFLGYRAMEGIRQDSNPLHTGAFHGWDIAMQNYACLQRVRRWWKEGEEV